MDGRPEGAVERVVWPRGRRHEVIFWADDDPRLARKNIRTGLIVTAICMFMFGITFVVAAIYVS